MKQEPIKAKLGKSDCGVSRLVTYKTFIELKQFVCNRISVRWTSTFSVSNAIEVLIYIGLEQPVQGVIDRIEHSWNNNIIPIKILPFCCWQRLNIKKTTSSPVLVNACP